jgi:hypothetical protein
MVSAGGCLAREVLDETADVSLSGIRTELKPCTSCVDRASMIPDLLLALASITVLLSPFLVEAGMNYELRKNTETQEPSWNKELPS